MMYLKTKYFRELEKLSSRVQELEELGDINAVQQYTYVRNKAIKLVDY